MTEQQPMRAIVVGVQLTSEDPSLFVQDMSELVLLLKTLSIKVAVQLVQKRQKFSAKSLIGEGKVMEIKSEVTSHCANLVVFDHSLSPPQVRNLEKVIGCEILDRTGIILEIFARHARTNEAKTQVEIAQLEYMLPRMTGAWTHFGRQTGGGVRARGMGEKQIEIDRRRARERIGRLTKQLAAFQNEKRIQRKARKNELKVALVGYTNSGKTTLMNAMTRASFQAADVLFATLDANIRTLDPTTRPKILLSDTVGFIRNLPHSLIESFKSTLEEVLEADLILHVVDVSHIFYQQHMETTDKVLGEIGAKDIPSLKVFNKMDLVDDPHLGRVLNSAYPRSWCVSALDEEQVSGLRRHVFSYFENNMRRIEIAVPQEDQHTLSTIYRSCLILNSDFSDQALAVFEIRATPEVISKLKKFAVAKKEDEDDDEDENALDRL